MKQSIPTPVVAAIIVGIIAIFGFFIWRAADPSASAAGGAGSAGPSVDPNARKPDFSKMSPDQMQRMRGGQARPGATAPAGAGGP